MGLFWTPKKTVSPLEFKEKIRGTLYGKGFTQKEIDRVDEILRGDMDRDPNTTTSGMTQEEIASSIAWMKNNKDRHLLSDTKIHILEEQLKKHL